MNKANAKLNGEWGRVKGRRKRATSKKRRQQGKKETR